MINTFPVFESKSPNPDYYIMIEERETPSMYPEWESDLPPVHFCAYKVHLDDLALHKISTDELKDYYKFIIGRSERIAFWNIIRTIKEYQND